MLPLHHTRNFKQYSMEFSEFQSGCRDLNPESLLAPKAKRVTRLRYTPMSLPLRLNVFHPGLQPSARRLVSPALTESNPYC